MLLIQFFTTFLKIIFGFWILFRVTFMWTMFKKFKFPIPCILYVQRIHHVALFIMKESSKIPRSSFVSETTSERQVNKLVSCCTFASCVSFLQAYSLKILLVLLVYRGVCMDELSDLGFFYCFSIFYNFLFKLRVTH